MARKILSLEELGEFDQRRLSHTFEVELQKIITDMADRPGDNSVRKLVMQFDFKPVGSNLVLEDVETVVRVQAKIPPRQTRKYNMKSKGGNRLQFNDESHDSAAQGTLDELQD